MSGSRWWYLFHQKSEELRLNNLVLNFTISNPGWKTVSSNASPGWTVSFFLGDDRDFLNEGVKTYQTAPMWSNSPSFFSLHIYSLPFWQSEWKKKKKTIVATFFSGRGYYCEDLTLGSEFEAKTIPNTESLAAAKERQGRQRRSCEIACRTPGDRVRINSTAKADPPPPPASSSMSVSRIPDVTSNLRPDEKMMPSKGRAVVFLEPSSIYSWAITNAFWITEWYPFDRNRYIEHVCCGIRTRSI
jgi:hypothetical protein